MASKVEICNRALAHVGHTERIVNIDSEKSQAANLCRIFYDEMVDVVLRDFPWPFATKTATLQLIESNPTTEWGYSYRYPPDCLFFRRIQSGVRNERADERVPYRIIYSSTGRLIYTDEQTAVGEYTMRTEDVIHYPPDFVVALTWRLAFEIGPSLMRGDPFKRLPKLEDRYYQALSVAAANSANEEVKETEPDSDFEAARD